MVGFVDHRPLGGCFPPVGTYYTRTVWNGLKLVQHFGRASFASLLF